MKTFFTTFVCVLFAFIAKTSASQDCIIPGVGQNASMIIYGPHWNTTKNQELLNDQCSGRTIKHNGFCKVKIEAGGAIKDKYLKEYHLYPAPEKTPDEVTVTCKNGKFSPPNVYVYTLCTLWNRINPLYEERVTAVTNIHERCTIGGDSKDSVIEYFKTGEYCIKSNADEKGSDFKFVKSAKFPCPDGETDYENGNAYVTLHCTQNIITTIGTCTDYSMAQNKTKETSETSETSIPFASLFCLITAIISVTLSLMFFFCSACNFCCQK